MIGRLTILQLVSALTFSLISHELNMISFSVSQHPSVLHKPIRISGDIYAQMHHSIVAALLTPSKADVLFGLALVTIVLYHLASSDGSS
jgi:hypothetical protein